MGASTEVIMQTSDKSCSADRVQALVTFAIAFMLL